MKTNFHRQSLVKNYSKINRLDQLIFRTSSKRIKKGKKIQQQFGFGAQK